MKRLLNNTPGRSCLRWTQLVLFGAAAMALGYCVFVLADTWLYQKRENREFNRILRQGQLSRLPRAPQSAGRMQNPPALANGLIGRLEIPRLGISTVVVEGTDAGTLRRAVGHIEGTALPGQPGNVGIAGHRDTFFRPLREIRRNDLIVVATLGGEYRYRVTSTKVVDPSAAGVLAPSAGQTLTLVTCYPFYFVGAAPDRFIVRAERISG